MKQKDKMKKKENIPTWKIVLASFSVLILFLLALGFSAKDEINIQEERYSKERVCHKELIECSWTMYNLKHGVTLCADEYFINKCNEAEGDYCIFYEWKVEPKNYSYWAESCEEIEITGVQQKR